MRDMAGEYKMTLRTLWDANDVLNELEARTARDRESWQVHREDGAKKKPTRAAIVTAAILHLKSLEPAAQERAIRAAMGTLNGLIRDAHPAATQIVPPQSSPRPGGEARPPGGRKKHA